MNQFIKYPNNPVLGSKELGTCFDVYVWRDNGRNGHDEYIGFVTKEGRELF